MSSAILITGAAGFAGSHLLDLLAASDGNRIVAWHRPGGHPPRTAPNTQWDSVDLLDAAQVEAAVARTRPAIVYHCAGAAHVGRSWRATEPTFALNVRGTHYLLQALERAEIAARVLIPSSALVYATSERALSEDDRLCPSSPYGLSKLAQEMLGLRTNGRLTIAIARPFNHFGPRQDAQFAASAFARRIADIERGRFEPEMAVGNLDARRDLTDVRDTVRAYQLIVERGAAGRPYNICTGRAIAIGELLDRLLARARVKITIKTDPSRLRPNDTPLLVGDARRAHEELGWTASIPLEQTLDDLLQYWRGRTR